MSVVEVTNKNKKDTEKVNSKNNVKAPSVDQVGEVKIIADEANNALDAEVETPAPLPILEVPDPIEAPVEAAVLEQCQGDVHEPELLQEQIEDIEESIDSLTVDDLSE